MALDQPVDAISSLIANLIADQPAAIAQLLAQHVDDGHGRCRRCSIGGQCGNHAWPCILYTAAAAAADRSR
jgi:hypothetical protein